MIIVPIIAILFLLLLSLLLLLLLLLFIIIITITIIIIIIISITALLYYIYTHIGRHMVRRGQARSGMVMGCLCQCLWQCLSGPGAGSQCWLQSEVGHPVTAAGPCPSQQAIHKHGNGQHLERQIEKSFTDIQSTSVYCSSLQLQAKRG